MQYSIISFHNTTLKPLGVDLIFKTIYLTVHDSKYPSVNQFRSYYIHLVLDKKIEGREVAGT